MPASKRTPSTGKHHGSGEPSARPPLASERGFTLIEVLIAAVVLVVGLATLFGLLDSSVKATYQTRAREGATNLARQIIEDGRTIPYAQLSPASVEGELQTMNGLADSSGAAGWQIVGRAAAKPGTSTETGITYTVTASECSIDDPKDGLGEHDNTFCAGEAAWKAGEAKDQQPADLKRVTVDVKWVAPGRSPDVRMVSTLTAAGGVVGLSASNLQLTVPGLVNKTAPVISTEPANNLLVFTFTAPSGTTGAAWSLEGSRQTPAPTKESGTTWTFSWNIKGISDGTYKVSAQAINASGVTGPPVSISVTLIRNTPKAPTVTAGGFNTVNVSGAPKKVVELQWQANAERNIIGYRVYNPSKELVCPSSPETLSLAVSCIDFLTAPGSPKPTDANLTYTVVALYRKAEGETLSKTPSETPPGAFKVIGGEPPPSGPNVPGSPLTLVRNLDGSVTLTWSAPSGGTAVSFYRIYRSSTNYDNRYDVTSSGTTTTYTDRAAGGEHSYWVSAVSSTLTESPFLGPVTG